MTIAAQLEKSIRQSSAIKFTRAVSLTTDRLDRVVPRKTGKLARSRKVRIAQRGNGFSAMIEYGPEYGRYLDEGVRPRVLPRKREGVYRFRVGGRVVYTRGPIKLPGTKKHMGWFSRPTSLADWSLVLRRVFGA